MDGFDQNVNVKVRKRVITSYVISDNLLHSFFTSTGYACVDLPQVDHFCVVTVFATRDEVASRKVVSGRLVSLAGFYI